MDLPPGSPLVRYTLENPYPLAAVLLVVGLGLWNFARWRSMRRVKHLGLILAAAAPLLVVAATLIETTAERLTRHTVELVEAAIAGDSATVAALLDDEMTLLVGSGRSGWGREEIIERVPWVAQIVTSNNLRTVRAVRLDANRGESVFAQTTMTHMGAPTPNEWRVRWVRSPDGAWRIRELIWEQWQFGQTPGTELLRWR